MKSSNWPEGVKSRVFIRGEEATITARKTRLDRAIQKFRREAVVLSRELDDYCPVCGLKNWHWLGCRNGPKSKGKP